MVEPAGVEPASPACRAGILPLDDDPMAVPTGIEPASTLLDRQAAYPDAYGTSGVATRSRTGTKRFTASGANGYTMATMKRSARGESNADLPVIGRLHCRCATSGLSGWRDLNPRPHGPEPCALPAALHPVHVSLAGSAPATSGSTITLIGRRASVCATGCWSGWQESNLLPPRSSRGCLHVTYTQVSRGGGDCQGRG